MPTFPRALTVLAIAAHVALASRIPVSRPKSDEFSAYRPCLGLSTRYPGMVAMRTYTRSGNDSILLIDPVAMTTTTDAAPKDLVAATWEEIREKFPESAWMRALDDASQAEGPLQDAGIRRADHPEEGIDLTVDLCPSRRGLDRAFFREVLSALESEEKPVPIGLSVSGLWMIEHRSDLAWLKSLAEAGRIRPIWIDHSFHHRVDPRSPLDRNFLLEPGTDLAEEVFDTEKEMLRNGLVPSPFFRFPGLVSRDTLIGQILSWGLVPVGCDAWLAKNQKARDGSIVLVHANGNEPLGLMRFRLLLRQHSAEIRRRKWFLYDLRGAISD